MYRLLFILSLLGFSCQTNTCGTCENEKRDRAVAENFDDGKALFQANCASCHHPVKDVTGPAFKTIAENRSMEWIVKFVSERDKLKGDSLLKEVQIYDQEIDCVRFPDLTQGQIDAIFNFVSGCSGQPTS